MNTGWTPELRIIAWTGRTILRGMLLFWAYELTQFGMLDWRVFEGFLWCLSAVWLKRTFIR